MFGCTAETAPLQRKSVSADEAEGIIKKCFCKEEDVYNRKIMWYICT